MGHTYSQQPIDNQTYDNQIYDNQIYDNQIYDNIVIDNTEQTVVETMCRIKDALNQEHASEITEINTSDLEKINKRIRVLECRNKLLSELLKAETSNYDSLRKQADDLALENKMLRKRIEQDKISRKCEDEDEDYFDMDQIDPVVILGMMTLV